jgi:hypothetical protein
LFKDQLSFPFVIAIKDFPSSSARLNMPPYTFHCVVGFPSRHNYEDITIFTEMGTHTMQENEVNVEKGKSVAKKIVNMLSFPVS